MRQSASPATPLFSDAGSGTVRLLAYLALSLVLMVTDFRGDHLARIRAWAGVLAEPVYVLAELPARLVRGIGDGVADRGELLDEREHLRRELLIAQAQLARLEQIQDENRKLRDLLGGTRGLNLSVQLAMLADFDLDPFRHRVVLDAGARDGVEAGTALIDAGGVYGQVTEVGPLRSTAMLISDPAHAIPVLVQRSGVRTIAYGTGDPAHLHIPNIPQSADVRTGDLLISSGLGGRFPAGLPVARVVSVRSDDTRLFLVADAEPTAQLGRGRELLLVRSIAATDQPYGPPRALAPGASGSPP